MAAAVGATILTAVGVADFAIIGTIGTVGSVTASQAIGTAAILAATVGIQYAITPKADAPTPSDGVQNLKQPIQSRRGIYGRCRVGGGYMFYESFGGNAGDILAVASGKISQFRTWYLHDKPVTVTLLAPTAVLVTPNPLTEVSFGHDRVRIDWRYGLDTETYFDYLAVVFPAGLWTADHRGDGIAAVSVVARQWTEEGHYAVFPFGELKTSVEVDGYALWDIRDTDQDPDDQATWVDYAAWSAVTTYAVGNRVMRNGVLYISQISSNLNNDPDIRHAAWVSVWSNPVLQIIDYLTNTVPQRTGMRLDRAALVLPVIEHLRTQANLCDEIVERGDGSHEPRYRSDGFFTFDTDPEQVVGSILATCDGWMCEDFDGTLALQVGVYSDPTKGLQKRHILDFSIDAGVGDEEEVNEIPFSFTSWENGYNEVPGDPWRDETAITLSGKVRSQPLALNWVQSHAQGRRLAKRAMARLNSSRRGEVTCTLYGLYLLGQRWIGIDDDRMGLNNAVAEVQSAEVDLRAGRVTFKWQLVDGETVDEWDAEEEEGDGIPDPDILVPEAQYVPENIAGVVGGSPPFRIDLTWDYPDRDDYRYRVRYRLADLDGSPGPWTEVQFSEPTIIADRVFATIYPTTDDIYEVQVASVGAAGSVSEWAPDFPLVISTVMPSLDYSRPQNSAKWLFLNTF